MLSEFLYKLIVLQLYVSVKRSIILENLDNLLENFDIRLPILGFQLLLRDNFLFFHFKLSKNFSVSIQLLVLIGLQLTHSCFLLHFHHLSRLKGCNAGTLLANILELFQAHLSIKHLNTVACRSECFAFVCALKLVVVGLLLLADNHSSYCHCHRLAELVATDKLDHHPLMKNHLLLRNTLFL